MESLPLPSVAVKCRVCSYSRVVLLGDLNYRIAMDDDEARQLVRARKWSMLLENDELLLELSKGRQFDGWHEGLVTFAPTYKYHRNSDKFYWWTDGGANNGHQNSKQHRAPAWSDTRTRHIGSILPLSIHSRHGRVISETLLIAAVICRCDRILWRGKGMMQTRYESCGGYRLSDHRPVRAVFHAVSPGV
jgi:phosphatidylinositol-bisphosphatase